MASKATEPRRLTQNGLPLLLDGDGILGVEVMLDRGQRVKVRSEEQYHITCPLEPASCALPSTAAPWTLSVTSILGECATYSG